MFHMQYVKIRLLNVAILTSMISFQINSAVPIINTLQYAARDIEDHDRFGKWMDERVAMKTSFSLEWIQMSKLSVFSSRSH